MTKAPLIAAAALAASLSACQTTGYGDEPAEVAAAEPAQVAADTAPPAFVEAACGGCHAVEPPFLSPNPASPSFEAIANREGLTEETLGTWLADAHNYPEVMDFDLEPGHIEQIANYMITLRRDDYVPAQ